MDELKKMGPLSSVMNMIPGAAGKMSDEDAERSEKEMARSRAIIYSMTPAERASLPSSTRSASGASRPAAAPRWRM